MPGRRRARHDELASVSSDDQHLLHAKPNLGEVAAKSAGIRPVDRGLMAVQEPGLRQQQNPRAGRAQHRPAGVHRTQPPDYFGVAAGTPIAVGHQHGRQDDDIRLVDVPKRFIGSERQAAGRGGGSRLRRNHLDIEGHRPGRRLADGGEQVEAVQHFVKPAQRRGHGIGNGHQADANGRPILTHRAGACVKWHKRTDFDDSGSQPG